MKKINTIVLDDRPNERMGLVESLQRTCPQVKIVASYGLAEQKPERILARNPDLVFLDVGRPSLRGLEYLEGLGKPFPFQLVLTDNCPHSQNIPVAFPILDYLKKPVDNQKLVQLVHEFDRKTELERLSQEVRRLGRMLACHLQPSLAFPTLNGFECVDVADILYCASANNYTEIHLGKNRPLLVSKCLKTIEYKLMGFPFVRVHKRHLVNLQYIKTYIKGDGGRVILKNGVSLNVSRNRKEQLLQAFTEQFA